MALNTNRTNVDFSFRHVEQVDKLGQSVGGVVATVQSLLDSRAEDNLTDVNNVKTTMRSTTVGDSGAKNIGASIYADVVGVTVQAQLEEINNKSATAFPVQDGSLGDIKLSNTAGQIKDVVEGHTAQLADIAHYISPTGTSDDTSYLQETINNNVSIVLKSGTYFINPAIGSTWLIPSNRIIKFEEGAILQAITNALDDYRVMFLNNVSNIEIHNPHIIGDKATHIGITGEGGHCLGIYNSNNIKVYNPKLEQAWGVGLALIYSNDVFVENVYVNEGRQNGIACVGGINVTVDGGFIENTSGTSPAAGVDLEPNFNFNDMENINFLNIHTKNNEGAGFIIALNRLKNGSKNVSINVDNYIDEGSEYGMYINKLGESLEGSLCGSINIRNMKTFNTKRAGLYISNYSALTSPKVTIDNPSIYNAGNSGGLLSQYDSGIVIYRETSSLDVYKIGNFIIKNPSVVDNKALPLQPYCIFALDAKIGGLKFINAIIENPIELKGTSTVDINYIFRCDEGIKVIDKFNTISGYFDSSRTLLQRIYTRLANSTGVLVNFNLEDSGALLDNEITFVNEGSGVKLSPSSSNIRPLSVVVGKYIQSSEKGARITIKRLSTTEWVILNQIGTWTVEAQ